MSVLDDTRTPGTESAIPCAPAMAVAASDDAHTACTPDIELELVGNPFLVRARAESLPHVVSTDTVSVEELCMSLLSLLLLVLLSLHE